MKVRNWREECKGRRLWNRNRKAGQNPPRVIAPIEEEEEEEEEEEGGGGGGKK
jgi:hypothetical protein